uniref:Uncharacterized protein n=1 Tax=Caenorhabditis japonica TaxID=281687 RepID=A0A8R1E899_CAEJA
MIEISDLLLDEFPTLVFLECVTYLNPIENVWALLARAVYRHGKQFQTVGELKDAVTEEWDKLQSSYLESLTQSMSNRLCQVMQKFVGPTSY